MSVIIETVEKGSPAYKAGLRSGYTLLKINDNEIMDVLDYRFYQNNEKITIEFTDSKGKLKVKKIKKKDVQDVHMQVLVIRNNIIKMILFIALFRELFTPRLLERKILNKIQEAGKEVIAVGKINALFNGYGITETYSTTSDEDGMNKTIQMAKRDFNGLCFVNLVDFDTEFGHRNNIDGYAHNLSNIDKQVGKLLKALNEEDVLIITADHGCDPATTSTDHSRENVPVLIYQKGKESKNLGTFSSFAEIGQIALNALIKEK